LLHPPRQEKVTVNNDLPLRSARWAVPALALCVGMGLSVKSARATVFDQTNLISATSAIPAAIIDPALVNPWGVSLSATSPFWISDEGTGVTQLNNGAGQPVVVAAAGSSHIGVAAPAGLTSNPTGQVSNNAGANTFNVSNGTTSASAAFIFASLNGSISAWNPAVVPGQSVVMVNNAASGAVYTGLAIAGTGANAMLYAANVHSGKVDVFNSAFQQLASFTDPHAPAGFVPFNVQTLDGKVFVTFAPQNAAGTFVQNAAGQGFVDEFNTDGTLIARVANIGTLNDPWGLAIAPPTFGQFAGDLLVGNFGNGTIDAFSLATDTLAGTLDGANGNAITLPGLWDLTTGNGASAGSPDNIYFTAEIGAGQGLFGELTAVPEPASLSIMLLGVGALGWIVFRTRRPADHCGLPV
jgi:uncharacterized protein (TIGR03118 family)